MKKVLKKIFCFSNFKYMVAFFVPLASVFVSVYWLDNDSWDVLAQGREIVESGIYYTDQLSMHEGLEITVQNYGFSVLFYLIFSVFGFAGIYCVMLLLNLFVCFVVYKICMLISNGKTNLSLLIMMVTDVVLSRGFVVTRAQMVSYLIFLCLIYVLELYVKTDKSKYLLWLPILAILQVNLHASLFWMLIVVVGVYIVDSIKAPKLHLEGYRTRPLVISGLTMLFGGLLNPYGLKMITFIFTSYGDARFHDMISELQHFSPLVSLDSAFLYFLIVMVIGFYIFGKKKNVRIRYLLMLFGFLAIGMNTIKGLSQLVLTMFFPLALLLKDDDLKVIFKNKIIKTAVLWVGITTICTVAILLPVIVLNIDNSSQWVYSMAMDAIDDDVNEGKKGDIKIYSGYNDGGYVEYRGYKPYIDPRGEVFLKKNNGKEDILYEWSDFMKRKISTVEMIEKYQFEFILVSGEEDPFFDLRDERYEMIFEQDSVRVFKKKKKAVTIFKNLPIKV